MNIEAILVAAITCVSGLLGALFGYLGVRHAANRQLQQNAMNLFFNARITAYTAYYKQYEKYIQNVDDPERLPDLLNAISSARLVASKETSFLLEAVALHLKDIRPLSVPSKEFQVLRGQLLTSMQKDLACIPSRDNPCRKTRK